VRPPRKTSGISRAPKQAIPKEDLSVLSSTIGDVEWRIRNLYWIVDKAGRMVRFRPNWAQARLLKRYWNRNIILKARQLGFTTLICLLWLDACLFRQNVRAGIIAHNQEDAKRIFRDKIKFAYDHLPEPIKEALPASRDAANELLFANNSSIWVATSVRSGTFQYLHVSEFGKICARYPEKAREIVSGSLEAVAPGQHITIESTAEGRSGYFYDYCQQARNLLLAKRKLTPLDFRFHFYPWWQEPGYQLENWDDVPIPSQMQEYFARIEGETKTKLTPAQRAWYTKKWEILGEDMWREYPSTPDEAFHASIQGAYFTREFSMLRQNNQICRVPVEPGVLVDTWWDLGVNDTTAIWFTQDVGREVHVIDFYEASGEGLRHYAEVLDRLAKERGYRYGRHVAPHDIRVRELGTGTSRHAIAATLGINFDIVPRVSDKLDSIETARQFLAKCWFDEERCSLGIAHLEAYRKEWDARLGTYKRYPLHDEHSNAADAFQTLAMGHQFRSARIGLASAYGRGQPRQIQPARDRMMGWT